MLGLHGTRRAVAAVMVALAGVSIAGRAEAQQIGLAPLEVRVPAPPTAARALGRVHLAYEVHITSFSTTPVHIDRLEAVSPGGTALGAWSGAQLRQRTMVVGQGEAAGSTAPLTLAPGQRAVVFLWVTLEGAPPVPDSLVHIVTATTADGATERVTTASVAVAPNHAAPLAAPVAGGPWVAVRGPSPSSGHRLSLVALDGVVAVPQRFAVDWARLDAAGTLFRGDGALVTDWFAYDTPVLAVADATVALVRDGAADTAPRTPAPSSATAKGTPGNVVVLQLSDGRFVTYAHLRAGTILVAQGERVRTGQPLARIGNSGNSLGPHLHFHVSTTQEPLGGEGLPFSIDHLELIGRAAGMGPILAGTPWTPQASQPARTIAGEMPFENMVVMFGE